LLLLDGTRQTPRALRVAVLGVALALAACSDDAEPGSEGVRYSIVFEELDEALISVWGRSEVDVYTVGSDFGAGKGPIVLHYDGSAWRRLATAQSGDLWWVHGFEGGPVLMGGAGGQILRWENDAFTLDTTPDSLTVYGIWGSAPDDVWAVGGAGPDGAFAWRYDGSAWTDVPLPSGIRETVSLFKVWGRGPDDVWLVGSKGTTLHWDGASVTEAPSGTTRTLFTVVDDGARFTAVGGQGDGVILENDGSGWKDVTPPGGKQPVYGVIGVSTRADGGVAAGEFGSVLERKDGVWRPVEHGLPVFDTFHSTWLDPAGGIWAVGGQVQSIPLGQGLMIHAGAGVPAGSYAE
jgi:hypothetical protein